MRSLTHIHNPSHIYLHLRNSPYSSLSPYPDDHFPTRYCLPRHAHSMSLYNFENYYPSNSLAASSCFHQKKTRCPQLKKFNNTLPFSRFLTRPVTTLASLIRRSVTYLLSFFVIRIYSVVILPAFQIPGLAHF